MKKFQQRLDGDDQMQGIDDPTEATSAGALSRRGFLKGVGGAGAFVVAAGGLSIPGFDLPEAEAHGGDADPIGPRTPRQRRRDAFRVRRDAALAYRRESVNPRQERNEDEELYDDQRGSFFKCLPQNELGEVDEDAYEAFLDALESGDPEDFEAIPLSDQADRRLANPQASYAYEMTGGDGHTSRIPIAAPFASALQSAEMAEVYWQALTRDVPFRDYETSGLIADAVDDLNELSETVGPKENGLVTAGTLFRGETPGDLVGPYISQLLWMPVPYGPSIIEQRYSTPVAGDDFMIDYDEWLAIQRGAAPSFSITFDPVQRYIRDGRGLGEYVHVDVTYQAYLNAALILLGLGPDTFAQENPYRGSTNQGGFVTFGAPEVLDLVTKAANVSLKAAWYQKWLVHRRLRPEVFGARIENQLNGTKEYGIDEEILNSAAVAEVFARNGNRLLPQAFPEGSPTHPSYPAGHATIAGACCTILKALFDEAYEFADPVEATADGTALDAWTGETLTLGGEVNKLANNVSLGRDTAGVHYRSDGVDGITAGEQVAIGVLRDYSRTYNETYDGFTLTRFDGQEIHILDGEVEELD